MEYGFLKLGCGVVDTHDTMCDDEGTAAFSGDGTEGDEDFSFAAFVFAHMGCGDTIVEFRVGESLLLECCLACVALETFGSPGERAPDQPTREAR